jgi:hypothetical protein
MLLQITEGNVLVKILDLEQVINPNQGDVLVQAQAGEEEQDPELIKKGQLSFPSGEDLPRCWIDPNYR